MSKVNEQKKCEPPPLKINWHPAPLQCWGESLGSTALPPTLKGRWVSIYFLRGLAVSIRMKALAKSRRYPSLTCMHAVMTYAALSPFVCTNLPGEPFRAPPALFSGPSSNHKKTHRVAITPSSGPFRNPCNTKMQCDCWWSAAITQQSHRPCPIY